VLLRQVLD